MVDPNICLGVVDLKGLQARGLHLYLRVAGAAEGMVRIGFVKSSNRLVDKERAPQWFDILALKRDAANGIPGKHPSMSRRGKVGVRTQTHMNEIEKTIRIFCVAIR